MDAAIVVAAIGSVTTVAGLFVGRRLRNRDMETTIYERLLTRLNTEMERLQKRIEHLEQQLQHRDAREQEHLREIAELRRERDDLRTKLTAAEATLASRSAEIERLSGLTEHAQAQLRAT